MICRHIFPASVSIFMRSSSLCVSLGVLSSPYKDTTSCKDLGPTLILWDLILTNYIFDHLISNNRLHSHVPWARFFWGETTEPTTYPI